MPELPEVECTVRYLEKRLKGQSIKGVKVNWSKSIERPALKIFSEQIGGAVFKTFSRRGKYIVLGLDSAAGEEVYLIAHLRMSGSFDVVSSSAVTSKHDQVVFSLDKDKELRFHDIRKFGKIYLVKDKEEILSKLGLEPLLLEKEVDVLYDRLKQIKSPIKTVLLRQDVLAGVGNIYADESLWAAKIHPLKLCYRLKKDEVKTLIKELRKILVKAIATNGTDNGDNVVDGGMYEPKAYGRAGKPCLRCKTEMKRILVTQRGTSFCPKCQRLSLRGG